MTFMTAVVIVCVKQLLLRSNVKWAVVTAVTTDAVVK